MVNASTHVGLCGWGDQVGVDVPEASVMVVEGADRFGLAALHQLRGRVGRGARPSRCFLIVAEDSARLAILETSHSGFSIAEADLVHRCGHPFSYVIKCLSGFSDV